MVPPTEAKAIYSHSARTKTPGVISQSTPRPVTKPALKALVLTRAQGGKAVVEAADRSAEQGIWQEGANGVSEASTDWHIINELELRLCRR